MKIYAQATKNVILSVFLSAFKLSIYYDLYIPNSEVLPCRKIILRDQNPNNSPTSEERRYLCYREADPVRPCKKI